MKSRILALSAFVQLVAINTFGQHADIRPYVESGQIRTAAFVDATGDETPNARVFGYDFGEDPSQPYFTQDPGFNASAASGLPSGSQLLFNIVAGSDFGLPANLTFWNGIGNVEFVVTPASESLTLNFGSQSRVVDLTNGFIAGFNLQTITGSGTIHRHLNALLGGSAGDPTPGIYLLPLELQSSDLSLQKSLPFFLVYNNGLDEGTHDLAIEWVENNLAVPEASTIVLAALACAGSWVAGPRRSVN